MQMKKQHQHHGAPDPIHISNELASGHLEILNTPDGERMRFSCNNTDPKLSLRVMINRPDGLEVLELKKISDSEYLSDVAPNEPHEFSAEFEATVGSKREVVPFELHEPHDHQHGEHNHDLMNDDEHARAHAATIPEYAKKGERPTVWQIITFGAAGGMIPCPASITVMLLALSIGKFGAGILAVAGFSIGLAITLVGIGLVVVAGLSRLQGSGRFHWVSSKAPLISAGVVMLSGIAALIFAH
jgi:nickel/cobalt exporter